MEAKAIAILDAHRIMAISTVRPDGWPQTTIVGYANLGLTLYFLIFRSSQKFSNIRSDDRVSLAVGSEPRTLVDVEAVYAAGHAREITDAGDRSAAWRLLVERHPNLAGFDEPSPSETAMMRLKCEFVSLVDYSQGLGHKDDIPLRSTV